MLILRTCKTDGSSPSSEARGFKWPTEVGAHIVAPDWSPEPVCGGGLHGWAWGQGSATVFCNDPDALWIVFEAPDIAVVDFDGKVKAKEATIQFAGPQKDATDFLIAHTPTDKAGPVIGACLSVGDNQMVAVGDLGTATAGFEGKATAGDLGKATAGDLGTATAGVKGNASAGYLGTATAGNYGKATAGVKGKATAGDHGTATAGNRGNASAGVKGTTQAGIRGEIHVRWWDARTDRFRTLVGYIGEDGLEADIPYKVEVSEEGTPRFVKAG